MSLWLTIFLGRWGSGERFRRATAEDYRFHFGFFFCMPVFLTLSRLFAGPFLNQAAPWSIWLGLTIAISLGAFGLRMWARYVPQAISLVLGIVAWGVFAWVQWP